MRQLTEILDNESILFRLNNITYKRLYNYNYCEITFEDSFKLSEIHEDMFSIILARHVHFVPESVFDITVEFEVGICRAENATESFLEYDLISLINNENVDEMTGYNFNKASAIISAITANFGLNPFITPPIFCYEEGDE